MTRKEKIREIDVSFQAEVACLKAQKEKSVTYYFKRVAELQCEAVKAKSAVTGDNPDTRKERIREIDSNLQAEVARLKAQKEKSISDYYTKIAELQCEVVKAKSAATDDDPDETMGKPTVWLDGSHHSAVIVARRLLSKLPHLNYKQESFIISLFPSFFGGYGLEIKYINTIDNAKGYTSCSLNAAKDSPDVQEKKIEIWLSEVDNEITTAKKLMGEESGNE